MSKAKPQHNSDEMKVRFGDMVKAMQYLTDEITNLRAELYAYRLYEEFKNKTECSDIPEPTSKPKCKKKN